MILKRKEPKWNFKSSISGYYCYSFTSELLLCSPRLKDSQVLTILVVLKHNVCRPNFCSSIFKRLVVVGFEWYLVIMVTGGFLSIIYTIGFICNGGGDNDDLVLLSTVVYMMGMLTMQLF